MGTPLTRFLSKALMEIVHAPSALFRMFYYQRPVSDEKLEAEIRSAIFGGGNVFVVGRTGEGKSCFLRNYIENHALIDVGFGDSRKKDLHYLRIYFDQPDWDADLTTEQLVKKIVIELQRYFDRLGVFPGDFDKTASLSGKYQYLAEYLNKLDFKDKPVQLIAIVDDIDHSPPAFQMRFYNAIYPLLRSPNCVCVLAVRPPAYTTALRKTSGKLAAVFGHFNVVILQPLPLDRLANYRVKQIFENAEIHAEIEEPDLAISDVQARYKYPVAPKVTNFLQLSCNGNLRDMSRLLIRLMQYRESEGSSSEERWESLGRTQLLGLLRESGLPNVFAHQNTKGYSLDLSCLEMLRFQARVNDDFLAALAEIGFAADAVAETLNRLYEEDIVEETFVADSYARVRRPLESPPVEYQLTSKGTWLMTMSSWPQYRALYPPPLRTLTRHGVLFESRVIVEFLEFVLRFAAHVGDGRSNYYLNWIYAFNLFRRVSADWPSEHGSPGDSGYGRDNFYRRLQKEGVVRKDLGNYPKVVVVNRYAFEEACKRWSVVFDDGHPFFDDDFFEQHLSQVVIASNSTAVDQLDVRRS